MRILKLFLLIMVLSAPAFSADGNEVMTNQDVVDMVEAKFGEEMIITKIKSSDCRFDTTTKALIKLKKAGVPENIINLMHNQMIGLAKSLRSKIKLEVLHLAEDDKPNLRDAAMVYILQQGPVAVPYLREGLTNNSPKMRAAAVYAIGKVKDLESASILRTMLTDSQPEVRLKVAEALTFMEDKAALDMAHKSVATGVKPMDGFIRFLGYMKSTRSAGFIRARMLEENDPLVREQAAWALGEIGDKDARKDLEHALLKDKTAGVRAACAEALGRLGMPESVDALKRLCRNDKSKARTSALKALGGFSAKDAVPFIIEEMFTGNCGILSEEEIEAMLITLRKLTHQDYGRDAIRWLDWYKANKIAILGEEEPAASKNSSEKTVVESEVPEPPLPPIKPINTPNEGKTVSPKPLPELPPVNGEGATGESPSAPELPELPGDKKDVEPSTTGSSALDKLPVPPMPEEGKAKVEEQPKKTGKVEPPGIFSPEIGKSGKVPAGVHAEKDIAAMKGPSIEAKSASAEGSFVAGQETSLIEVPGIVEVSYKSDRAKNESRGRSRIIAIVAPEGYDAPVATGVETGVLREEVVKGEPASSGVNKDSPVFEPYGENAGVDGSLPAPPAAVADLERKPVTQIVESIDKAPPALDAYGKKTIEIVGVEGVTVKKSETVDHAKFGVQSESTKVSDVSPPLGIESGSDDVEAAESLLAQERLALQSENKTVTVVEDVNKADVKDKNVESQPKLEAVKAEVMEKAALITNKDESLSSEDRALISSVFGEINSFGESGAVESKRDKVSGADIGKKDDLKLAARVDRDSTPRELADLRVAAPRSEQSLVVVVEHKVKKTETVEPTVRTHSEVSDHAVIIEKPVAGEKVASGSVVQIVEKKSGPAGNADASFNEEKITVIEKTSTDNAASVITDVDNKDTRLASSEPVSAVSISDEEAERILKANTITTFPVRREPVVIESKPTVSSASVEPEIASNAPGKAEPIAIKVAIVSKPEQTDIEPTEDDAVVDSTDTGEDSVVAENQKKIIVGDKLENTSGEDAAGSFWKRFTSGKQGGSDTDSNIPMTSDDYELN